MISHKNLSIELAISAKTLTRHKKSLEKKYSVEFGTRDGREIVYTDQQADLLKLSVNHQELPDTISIETPFENQIIDAESVVDIVPVVRKVLPPQRDDDVCLDIDLIQNRLRSVQDVSALQAQTQNNFDSADSNWELFEELVILSARKKAQVLAEQIKSEYAHELRKAATEAVNKAVRDE